MKTYPVYGFPEGTRYFDAETLLAIADSISETLTHLGKDVQLIGLRQMKEASDLYEYPPSGEAVAAGLDDFGD